jgi:hypothetical protein
MSPALWASSLKVLGLYRKRSGSDGRYCGRTLRPGAFSIERLEVSRFGNTSLWILSGGFWIAEALQ